MWQVIGSMVRLYSDSWALVNGTLRVNGTLLMVTVCWYRSGRSGGLFWHMSMYSGSRRSSLSRMRFGDFPPGYSGSRMGFVMPGICVLGSVVG